MKYRMSKPTRNTLGLTFGEIEGKLNELLLAGKEITCIKEWWPVKVSDFFSFGFLPMLLFL